MENNFHPESSQQKPKTKTSPPPKKQPPFILIGFPIGVDQRNRERRNLLRELWVPEYPNIGETVAYEFIIGTLTSYAQGHPASVLDELYHEDQTYGDLALVNAREATYDPYRGDPKCTGEKLVAWFQYVSIRYRKTAFFIKADWDTWIHTPRLEINLRRLATRKEPTYFGNTLWCSYSVLDFQPCGYGFGPLQAAGSRKTECPPLPRSGSSAVGPYPYAAGLFWGMSSEVVQWIAWSPIVNDFVRNASMRLSPPYWVKGEDSAFGFFAHISPFPRLSPLHWGWDVVHDGWEFRSEKERGICTAKTSNKSIVVHSMHTRADFELVRSQFRERCDAACVKAELPFEVDGLADLCSRNPSIPRVYSRCASAGFQSATESVGLSLDPVPRRKCRSIGAAKAYLASLEEGGTIVCDGVMT